MNETQAVAHSVFFTLKDESPESRRGLIEACRRDLSGLKGIREFHVGERASDLTRPVNDVNFHVALHIVFENKAAHDAYQEAPPHVAFVKEQKDNWQSVRIFDAYLA